ncbi:MAG: endonuclease/exonuclease/phosphatase family protein [Luteolibacter sp.]
MISRAAAFFLLVASLAQGVGIRVATFNIGAHLVLPGAYFDYGIGAPGQPDYDNVRDVLGRINADVVALEEMHRGDETAGYLTTLANSLGYPYVFDSPSTNAFDTSLHVVFLSRFPFLSQTLITSPAGSKDMTRLIPVVKVDVPGTTRDPVLIGAHLKSGSEASDIFQRTVEMRRLTSYLANSGLTANDNFVIMGDFNLSDNDRTFSAAPASGLPSGFVLGPDITFPINYFTNPPDYYSSPAVTRIIPKQLNDSTVTFKSQTSGSESTIDLFIVSQIIGTRPLHTEVYNSALDTSNTSGLSKAGSPLPSGTSVAASDHLAVFGDIELDPALPYAFNAPGETVSESFNGFTGTYDPYPWTITGGAWQGTDSGTSPAVGFHAYGTGSDPSLGYLPGTGSGTATAAFVNNSTKVLSALRISFTPEQWRSTNAGTADTLSAELIVGGVPQPLPQLAFNAATDLATGAIAGGTSAGKTVIVTGLSVAPGAPFQLKFTFAPGAGGGVLPADVFINEFDYDDNGTDTGEFVEIVAGPGFTGPLSGVSLVLYRGDGTVYGTHLLSTFSAGAVTSSGHKIYSKLISGLQNSTSGMALAVNGAVTQFISYEGVVKATAGAAIGLTSTNIGVSQTGNEPEGESALELTGTGGSASSFTWTQFPAIPYSVGDRNQGQTFTIPKQPQGIAIDNLAVTFLTDTDLDGIPDTLDPDDDNDGITDASEAIFGSNPLDANSVYRPTIAQSSPTTVTLSFTTLTGRRYTVESSTDLSFWKPVSIQNGTGAPISIPFSSAGPQVFYRLAVGYE